MADYKNKKSGDVAPIPIPRKNNSNIDPGHLKRFEALARQRGITLEELLSLGVKAYIEHEKRLREEEPEKNNTSKK
jgi:hypothetical protein